MSEKKEKNGAAPAMPVKIETKAVRHVFTTDESNELGKDLSRAIGSLRNIESEFDQVKASYKARTAEAEAKIGTFSTSISNGFDLRSERCRVHYFPKERKKRYFLEADAKEEHMVLEEEMSQDDYQQELILADGMFDKKEEIALFAACDPDSGILMVGRMGNLWYSAIRVQVGKHSTRERMDSEQPGSKKRWDAITRAADRYSSWLLHVLGKESAQGFADPLKAAIEIHRERVE